MSRLKMVVVLTLAGLLAAGGGCAGDPGGPPPDGPPGGEDPPVTPEPIPKQETCVKHASLRFGEYAVTNNMHGEFRLVEGDSYEQCVANDSGGFPVTWRWAVETEQPYVKGFPQISFGRNPWTQLSTTEGLPSRVADIASLRVTHDVTLAADGIYNLAFDLWLATDETPAPEELTHEVMIWLTGTLPAGEGGIGEAAIDGETYDFYAQQPKEGPPLFMFVAQTPRPSGSTDLLGFLRYLEASGRVQGDVFLSIVELGTEMWEGEGSVLVSGFSVDLEKK